MASIQGVGGSGLRWLGAMLLAAGLFIAYSRFPTRSIPDYATIRSFELDSEECREFRSTRLTTELTANPAVLTANPAEEAPPTIGEVAEKFNLELALVCQANNLPADCGVSPAPSDEPLRLPLYRDPTTAPPRL